MVKHWNNSSDFFWLFVIFCKYYHLLLFFFLNYKYWERHKTNNAPNCNVFCKLRPIMIQKLNISTECYQYATKK